MSTTPLDFGPLPHPTVTRTLLTGAFEGHEDIEIEWSGAVVPFDRAPAAVRQAMRTVDEALPMLRPQQRRVVAQAIRAILTRGGEQKSTVVRGLQVNATVAVEDGILDKAGDAPRLAHISGFGINAEDTDHPLNAEGASFHVGRRGGLTTYRTRKAKRGDGYVTDRYRGFRAWIYAFHYEWTH